MLDTSSRPLINSLESASPKPSKIFVATLVPGPMLSSTLSDMELDERGHLVRLIPSLSGKIYKLKDEMVEPIALDASTLLFSSLKMQVKKGQDG